MPIQCHPAPTDLGATDKLAKVLCETFAGEAAHQLIDGLFAHPYEQIFPTNYQESRPYFYDHLQKTEDGQQPQIFYWRCYGWKVPELVEAMIRHGLKTVEKTNDDVTTT